MKKLELFEPAMCCSTGVCGPAVDENLLRVTAVFEALAKTKTIEGTRYNLTSAPAAFVNQPEILKIMQEQGKDALPITVLDGEIVKTGAYPDLKEFSRYTGVVFLNTPKPNQAEGGKCC
jgi:hypothetical protein